MHEDRANPRSASLCPRRGRLRSEDDAVREAFALWERGERARAEILANLAAAESMRELAAEVKQRGRTRLAATQAPKT
jgi:Arc/MetJ-type ribon-helix-helix transcriptional regulator